MKIGMLLPSLLMSKRFEERIFAPKPLFLSLVDGLLEKGHQVFVYSASDTPTRGILIGGDKLLEKEDLPSVRLRHDDEEFLQTMSFKLTYNEYEADLTLKAFLHAQKEKVEIIHSYHDFLAHYFARLVPEIPIVYTLHDPPYSAGTIEGWRFDHFPKDNYIAISHHQAESYKSRVKIIDVVYHGIETKSFPFSEAGEDYFAFIGRFIPEKGVVEAINVAKKLGVSLHMASSSNYLDTPYYQKVIKPHLDNPLIKVTGYLHPEERNNWLMRAKALIFPILWDEPFGLVMVEAMACGTPVVAYARGSVPEVVVDGVTGFVVEPEEGMDGLVEAVKRINVMSRQEYGKMRLACRKRVEENFTVERMVEGYERVYRKILEQ